MKNIDGFSLYMLRDKPSKPSTNATALVALVDEQPKFTFSSRRCVYQCVRSILGQFDDKGLQNKINIAFIYEMYTKSRIQVHQISRVLIFCSAILLNSPVVLPCCLVSLFYFINRLFR